MPTNQIAANRPFPLTEEPHNPFKQLCVLHGVDLGDTPPEKFEAEMEREFGCRFKFEAQVWTRPDLDRFKKPIPDTGGRADLFFYVHEEDVNRFAEPRFQWGIRWWEDVIVYNKGNRHLYTSKFIKEHPPTW